MMTNDHLCKLHNIKQQFTQFFKKGEKHFFLLVGNEGKMRINIIRYERRDDNQNVSKNDDDSRCV